MNAQITAIEHGLPANMSPQQRAASIAQLETIRARANAQFDAAALRLGCRPPATSVATHR